MILTKLAAEYERLAEQGKLDRPGWINTKVAYALELDLNGKLIGVLSLRITEQVEGKNGKLKTNTFPRSMAVPEPIKRSSGIAPNFLCDNCTYLLGIETKENAKPGRNLECFAAAKERHHALLDPIDNDAARAVCRFFDTWSPADAESNSVLKPYLEDIKKSGNLIFSVNDVFAHEDPEVRTAWQNAYDSSENDIIAECLDIGAPAPAAILHPSIKGVRGAKSTGASLVSFNARAYESYGKDGQQGLNAPVSKYTTFAYGAALNYLLADYNRVQIIGDTTMVCWAESGSEEYQDCLSDSLGDGDVQGVLKALARGDSVDLNGFTLGPDEPFYILGLAPNAARISVRFFLQGTFGEFAKNIDAHYRRLQIAAPPNVLGKRSVWGLLQETVNQNASDKSPKPHLAGDLLRAVLLDTRYPETLLNAVEIRIRADRELNWRRAAIIKAYLMKNKNLTEEELVMDETGRMHSVYGKLGQLFSLFEQTQLYAMRGKDYSRQVGRTIVDRFFTSASTTPALVFPTIVDLNKKHLAKIKKDPQLKNKAKYLEIRISELLGEFYAEMDAYPARLDLTQRGQFQLGYYFENQRRFAPAGKQDSTDIEEDIENA